MNNFGRAIALVLLASLTFQLEAQQYVPSAIRLNFTPGLSFTDGVPFDESAIEKYKLYCDGAFVRDVPNDYLRSIYVTVDDLGSGDHTCALSELVEGIESIQSNPKSFSLGQRTPSAPTLTVVVAA